jgi:hypothetical protein
MTTEKMQIRQLKQKDRVTIAVMVRKLVDKLGDTGLLNLIVHDEKAKPTDEKARNDIFARTGINILKTALEIIEDDVLAWFCDLVGKTKEEFGELPIDIEIQIMEQLAGASETNDFFSGALRLSKKMQGLVAQYQKEKTR